MYNLFRRKLKRDHNEDVTLVLYAITEDFKGYNIEKEDTKRTHEVPHIVRVVLLCILLTAVTGAIWIKYSILNVETNQLHTRYQNLNTEVDQLQTSYNNIQNKLAIIDTQAKLGWKFFKYSFYYISTDKKNWDESRQYCRERGADLVIINSTDEWEFIKHLACNNQFWIGLSKRETTGVWEWVDGTELIKGTGFLSKWEPNDVGNNEKCVEIWGKPSQRGWNDRTCFHEQNWLCERVF